MTKCIDCIYENGYWEESWDDAWYVFECLKGLDCDNSKNCKYYKDK